MPLNQRAGSRSRLDSIPFTTRRNSPNHVRDELQLPEQGKKLYALETESLAAFASPGFFWNPWDHNCPALKTALPARTDNTPRGVMAERALAGRVH